MSGVTDGPGATRTAPGTVVLNGDRSAEERATIVVTNTGDRPVQIGSHIHLPDANSALDLDRAAAHGFRLDIPSGTSRRFEPGASQEVAIVALRGARTVPGIQVRNDGGVLDG
ncbi:urease subunit beta [Nocardioides sp. GY 10113]|uniref:urease subunit beta n=1 Tax=Nocardioides sp. GY 10113 TaxID=2569761 RepID=UPI0010A86C30|nr:urease subunit beta [Nocardioides sp. GY 10113]TIC87671.1 urease subunit beta [Nocardioides sp. GY 10113]